MAYKKNRAERVTAHVASATDGSDVDVGVTATISKDGGAYGAVTNAATNISGGMWTVALTDTEMDADHVSVRFAAAGAITKSVNIRPDVNVVSDIVGQFIQNLDDLGGVISENTAQAVTATTITLAAAETSDHIKRYVYIQNATTGAEQLRLIHDYNPTTKVATVRTWETTPTGTITYRILNSDQVDPFFGADKITPLGQSLLPDSPTAAELLGWLYKQSKNRNVHNRTTGVVEVYNDAASAVDQKADVTDAGNVTTRDGFVAGP